MNRMIMLVAWVLVPGAMVLAATEDVAPSVAADVEMENDTGHGWVSALTNRLEIGIRFTQFTLESPTKGHRDANGEFTGEFLGSIYKLEEDQQSSPLPFIRYYFTRYFGVEVGYDELRAITRKSTNPDDSHDTDGTIDMEGPVVELMARYPNSTRFSPYAGAGAVFYSGKFDYASWWHNGFPAYNDPGYEEWVSEGSPAWPNGGYQRNITLSDSTGYLVSGGCSIRIYKGLELDLEARYMQADVDAHYTLSYYGTVVDDRGKSNFPLDNTAYQASLKYSF